MIVPREYLVAFDKAMKHEYVRWLEPDTTSRGKSIRLRAWRS